MHTSCVDGGLFADLGKRARALLWCPPPLPPSLTFSLVLAHQLSPRERPRTCSFDEKKQRMLAMPTTCFISTPAVGDFKTSQADNAFETMPTQATKRSRDAYDDNVATANPRPLKKARQHQDVAGYSERVRRERERREENTADRRAVSCGLS